MRSSLTGYRLAIEHDSTFALGYAGLAGVYGFIADYALGPAAPALDSARIMARRAVALDSTLPNMPNATESSLESAMSGHILAQGQLTGRYAKTMR